MTQVITNSESLGAHSPPPLQFNERRWFTGQLEQLRTERLRREAAAVGGITIISSSRRWCCAGCFRATRGGRAGSSAAASARRRMPRPPPCCSSPASSARRPSADWLAACLDTSYGVLNCGDISLLNCSNMLYEPCVIRVTVCPMFSML
jgi:hypothetical protein